MVYAKQMFDIPPPALQNNIKKKRENSYSRGLCSDFEAEEIRPCRERLFPPSGLCFAFLHRQKWLGKRLRKEDRRRAPRVLRDPDEPSATQEPK